MVDRDSASPVATSPSALPTRSATKSPLSAAKEALAKTHQIHPTSEPAPITVDLPESTFQHEAPNGHSDSIPPVEGEAEEAESQSKQSHSLEEAEGRVNGTVNGTDSNNDSPTGDDLIQSDAASPKPPDSYTEPKPTDKASEDLELEPSSTALASPPVASRQSSPSQPEEVPPSEQDARPSDSITAPPPDAEPPSVQGLTEENLETATDSAVTTQPAKSASPEPDNKVSEVVADSRESEASGSSADINVAATVLQTEVDVVPEAEEQGISDTVETTAAPSGVVDPPLEPTEPSSPDAPAAADDSSDAKQTTADADKGDDDMDTSFTHGVTSLQPPQFFPDSDMAMMPDSSSLLPHQPGLGFDNVEDLSQATGPADPSTGDVSSMPDFMRAQSSMSNDMSLSVTDFINDPPDSPQMDVDPTSSIPFPPTSTSTDPAPSSLSSLPAPDTNLSSSNPTQPLSNGPTVSQPQPSGPGSSSSPVQGGLQPSPSWAPTSVSDVDGATNGSATAAESTSSPTTSQAANPTTEVKPSTQAENASKNVTSPEQKAPSTNGTSGEASHGVSPNAASTAVNSDAGDHKPPSPALPKVAANAGAKSIGDPKAGLVLSLNEELIKICVAFSSITPTPAEANEYQTRLSSNLGWLASVADTATQHLKPGSAVSLPILQPPKPLPPSPLMSQCAESLQKLPGLYSRMQEAFRPDYERRMRREAKMRARAGFNAAGGAGIGGPSASALPPPGAAIPVAGVKREHEADVETGDRKRAAVGGSVPRERTMSAGGSPTRPSSVRGASLALSSTQSPVLGQSPVTAATPGAAGGMQMASNVSTPRIPATGFVPPISMPHRHSPQNSISTSNSGFGQNPQVSPVGMAHQQRQRQPSLPPNAQQSPTHPQLPINNQFGQLQQHQQAQAGLMAQTTGDAGLTLQRPPSVSQPTGTFPQPQPSFQAPGMNNRTQQQQQQQAMLSMGMGGQARPPMTDDQRNQQLQQMQMRQQMAAQQGLTPMQLQQQLQAQAFGQIHTQQPQGGVQPNAMNAGGPSNPTAGPSAGAGAGQMNNQQPMNQVQATIQHLHNPNNPITQHLHRSVPNFGGLPLQVQVNQFHAVQMRLMQNQQQQQQQQQHQQQQQQQQQQNAMAAAANAANGNVNGTQGMQQRPPSAAGPGAMISGLRNMRQGTASPRIPTTMPPQGMATPQRQISGQHSGMNPPSSTVPPLGMGAQGMTPQQRQMMMMQQQQSQLSRMQPLGAGGQSPSPSHPQFGQGLPNMSPMNRQAAAQFGNQAAQQGQMPGGGAAGWSGATAGYVSSPLNPGWSPQATGSMSAQSPAGSGFHIGASPAHHSEAGATPRHSGATPQSGMGGGAGFGDSAASNGTDFANGGIDPSALFNEWTTQ